MQAGVNTVYLKQPGFSARMASESGQNGLHEISGSRLRTSRGDPGGTKSTPGRGTRMANGDSVSTTAHNFLSRIEAEDQLGISVKAALRSLADTNQLSNQDAIEAAVREEKPRVVEAEATAGEGPSRSS